MYLAYVQNKGWREALKKESRSPLRALLVPLLLAMDAAGTDGARGSWSPQLFVNIKCKRKQCSDS